MLVDDSEEDADEPLNSYRKLILSQNRAAFVKQEAFRVAYSSRKAGKDVVIPAFTRDYAKIFGANLGQAEYDVKKEVKQDELLDFEEACLTLDEVFELLFDDS